MEVNYTTTMDDYVAYNRYVATRSPVVWTLIVMGAFAVVLVFTIIGVAVGYALDNGWIILAGVIVGVLGGVLYIPLFWPLFHWSIRANAAQRGTHGMLGPTILILSDDGLVEITETTRSEVKWANIKGVAVDGDYTYIMVTGIAAALLPRYGFNDPRDYDKASEFAVEHAARAGKPVPS